MKLDMARSNDSAARQTLACMFRAVLSARERTPTPQHRMLEAVWICELLGIAGLSFEIGSLRVSIPILSPVASFPDPAQGFSLVRAKENPSSI